MPFDFDVPVSWKWNSFYFGAWRLHFLFLLFFGMLNDGKCTLHITVYYYYDYIYLRFMPLLLSNVVIYLFLFFKKKKTQQITLQCVCSVCYSFVFSSNNFHFVYSCCFCCFHTILWVRLLNEEIFKRKHKKKNLFVLQFSMDCLERHLVSCRLNVDWMIWALCMIDYRLRSENTY